MQIKSFPEEGSALETLVSLFQNGLSEFLRSLDLFSFENDQQLPGYIIGYEYDISDYEEEVNNPNTVSFFLREFVSRFRTIIEKSL